jgi:hypothetical protein
MKKITALIAVLATALVLTACGSNADTVSKNISKEAEQFKVQRHIVGINGITDKILFDVEGKCSIDGSNIAGVRGLEVTCKQGPGDYRKHFIGLSDNVTFVNVQTKGIAVDEYRTKIIIRPQSFIPDFDLVSGTQKEVTGGKPATGPSQP